MEIMDLIKSALIFFLVQTQLGTFVHSASKKSLFIRFEKNMKSSAANFLDSLP